MGFEKLPNSSPPEKRPLSPAEMQEILSALEEEKRRRGVTEGVDVDEFGSPELADLIKRLRTGDTGQTSQ